MKRAKAEIDISIKYLVSAITIKKKNIFNKARDT